jgi:integrin alpha FG-GAP repeat containing protein 1
VPSAALSQPLVFDADGDMKVDLLGYAYSNGRDSTSPRLWRNVYDPSEPDGNVFELSVFNLNTLTSVSLTLSYATREDPPFNATFDCVFPNPHSHAIIDLDGDCLAGLYIIDNTSLCPQ